MTTTIANIKNHDQVVNQLKVLAEETKGKKDDKKAKAKVAMAEIIKEFSAIVSDVLKTLTGSDKITLTSAGGVYSRGLTSVANFIATIQNKLQFAMNSLAEFDAKYTLLMSQEQQSALNGIMEKIEALNNQLQNGDGDKDKLSTDYQTKSKEFSNVQSQYNTVLNPMQQSTQLDQQHNEALSQFITQFLSEMKSFIETMSYLASVLR